RRWKTAFAGLPTFPPQATASKRSCWAAMMTRKPTKTRQARLQLSSARPANSAKSFQVHRPAKPILFHRQPHSSMRTYGKNARAAYTLPVNTHSECRAGGHGGDL